MHIYMHIYMYMYMYRINISYDYIGVCVAYIICNLMLHKINYLNYISIYNNYIIISCEVLTILFIKIIKRNAKKFV